MIPGRQMRLGRQIVILISFAVALLSIGCGEEKHRAYRVGILSGLNLFADVAESFKEEMTRLGYVEGKNIVYDLQKTNFEPDKERRILGRFVDDGVDLIFGFNTEVALEAKAATRGTGIPVVFANAFTEGNDLVECVREPGGNITGVRYPGIDIAVKRLEILHELAPHAKRVWLPYQKNYPAVPPELDVVRPAAASLGVALMEFPADSLAHLRAELERRSQSDDIGFDAVLLIPESLSTTKAAFEIIADFTRERRIPVGGSAIVTEDYGTVFAVTVESAEIGRLAAPLADKILRGTDAGTIPVVSPESVLKLNCRVAQELGLHVSEGLLSQASEIIR
ncbi:MAG: ABC transporter substrate-binding protein [Phycisphaerae bacterium]|nr:ABC transporter substrate-binding protein [Phycisphaerae bacterium]